LQTPLELHRDSISVIANAFAVIFLNGPLYIAPAAAALRLAALPDDAQNATVKPREKN